MSPLIPTPLSLTRSLIDLSSMLSRIQNIAETYLFGSYAKLIHTKESDIDLAIVLIKEDSHTVGKVKNVVRKIEKKYGKAIEIHYFEQEDMSKKDGLILEILRNGVNLF